MSKAVQNMVAGVIAGTSVVGGVVALSNAPAESDTPVPASVTEARPVVTDPWVAVDSDGVVLDIDRATVQDCFESGGNYRHGGGGCVPVNVK